MKLYYEVEENGYHIYDEDNSLFHIHQYEPFIPNRNLSYEENAQAQIDAMMAEEEEHVTQEERIASLESQLESTQQVLDAILMGDITL